MKSVFVAVQKNICLCMIFFGFYIFIIQILDTHTLWTPVGYVDTWPLYDRLMKFDTGQLSFWHYLFDPHVHPHSIVYFLYLIDVTYGSGRQLVPHFTTILSTIGLITTIWYVVWRFSSNKNLFNLRSCAFFISILILLSGLSEGTEIPFQVVVVATRFFYILLFSILVYCQFCPNKILHIVALVASALAVSFFASGGLFAAEIILLHLCFFKRWRWLLASTIPFLSYLLLVHYFPPLSGEGPVIVQLMSQLDFAMFMQFILGVISYYSTALLPWLSSWGGETQFTITKIIYFVFIAIVCISTVIWAICTLISLLIKTWQGKQTFESKLIPACLMSLISLFVFISGLSASILWIARNKLGVDGIQSSQYVLLSSRYAVFSSLALIVFFFILMNMKRRIVGMIVSLITFIIIGGIYLNSISTQQMTIKISRRDNLEFAATALLMGIDPAAPEATAIWPGVSTDWYWPTQLFKTVEYLHDTRISYAYKLPLLGQISQWPKAAILNYTIEPVNEKPKICRLNGTTFNLKNSFWVPQRFFPITLQNGEVVGYGLHTGNIVKGYMFCSAGNTKQLLFLSRSFAIKPSVSTNYSYY